MSPSFLMRFVVGVLAAASCLANVVGCASCCPGFLPCCPRIDPSGQQLFIWPNQTPATVVAPAPPPAFVGPPAAPAGATVVAPPPGATVVAPPPPPVAPQFGNLQAPPVYSDPGVPAAVAPAVVAPSIPSLPPPPTTVLPAAPLSATAPVIPALPPPPAAVVTEPTIVATPQVVYAPVLALAGSTIPVGCDHLRITPTHLVAPLNTEVMLKATMSRGDCTPLVNQHVDWRLDPNSPGQFSDVGPLYASEVANWVQGPRRIDAWRAVGVTATVPYVLNFNTPDTADDVQVDPGDAWVTLSSACEGTTVVTASTPALSQLNASSTTIHWVDVQWVIPQTVEADAGRAYVLTTNVMRRTNQVALAGWIVRYDVVGPGSLGYAGSNSQEATTDSLGRASVEISPNQAGGGVTQVWITVIRPPQPGSPVGRIEMGRTLTAITWRGGGMVATPIETAPMLPANSIPTFSTPVPISPGSVVPSAIPPAPLGPPPMNTSPDTPPASPDPYGSSQPPFTSAPTGKPKLQVQLRPTHGQRTQFGVGEFASYEVIVTNTGTATARNIVVLVRFDQGLQIEGKPGEFAVETRKNEMRDLPPGESVSTPTSLTFEIVGEGNLCSEVTVTADGAEPAVERACITAAQPKLGVQVNPLRQCTVGEQAAFTVSIQNSSGVDAQNVEVVLRFDPALEPILEQGETRQPDGSIVLRIDRLERNEKRTYTRKSTARAAGDAFLRVTATAAGGATGAGEGKVEVLAGVGTGAGGR